LNQPVVVVLEGDETGQELLVESLRVLDLGVTGLALDLERYDLSLESRRRSKNGVVLEAAEAMRRTGLGLKAATITPEARGDVGSPNAILRKAIDGKVILRIGRPLPNVTPFGGITHPIAIVRMAVGDAYEAKEWREGAGESEVAFRTERIERSVCRAVAEYAFAHAERNGAKVFGGPKYTVSPIYEGLLKEEMDAAAARRPGVIYDPQLIDTTYAMIVRNPGMPVVIPSLNRDGDCLSDLVMQLYGTIAAAESTLLAFDEHFQPSVVMAEAPHGTAPRLFGKNLANPIAMILACAAVLSHARAEGALAASRAIVDAVMECVRSGIVTGDLGGEATTSGFTDAVIARVRAGRSTSS